MSFITEHFLLQTDTARELYHNYAKELPIIDYHCHLSPELIASDHRFENITQIWLAGDHYKWRAMRAYGVDESFITGERSDREKFLKWSETVPATLRNPLYHWTHLELERYFGITEYLNAETARDIYAQTSAQLVTSDFSTQSLIRRMKVEVVCTTDDPVDTLDFHQHMHGEHAGFRMLPAFRPDKAMTVDEPAAFVQYVQQLGEVADKHIKTLTDYMDALKSRHDFFHEVGCRLSDHGINHVEVAEFTESQVARIFNTLLDGKSVTPEDARIFRSFMLIEFAKMDHAKGWVQQFHLGALRNTNSRLLGSLGADTGFDSMGDFKQAERLARFLDTLDSTDQLAKTILYNLNPADNELFATMAGNFNDGSVRGKMQYGSAWWFMDQLDGMEKQINTLSNMGLLSVFVGMLTDSRSFMSYPRHEYFRRLLCNIIGNDVEKGLLPNDIPLLSKLVEDVSYYNAKAYFNF